MDGFCQEASAITSRVSDWIVDLAAKGYEIGDPVVVVVITVHDSYNFV